MSHGIMEYDKGFVNGTTWHGIPAYVTQDTPVTIEQARSVMCFDVEKKQLFRIAADSLHEPVNAWCIVRPDKDTVLVSHVGNQFVAVSNKFLLNFIHENLLCKFPDLEIESVGTLWNGATTFVNLKIAEYQVKGDQSPTLSRLMYYNPLGMGAYQACAHDIRIVCNNTLRASAAQGAANKTLAKFRHTKSAGQRINDHLENLAEVKLGLEKHVEALNFLAGKEIQGEDLTAMLDFMFPLPYDKEGEVVEGRTASLAINQRDEVKKAFVAGHDSMSSRTAGSAYGLLQAATYFYDHNTIRNGDDAARAWDGMVGTRATKKDKVFRFLMEKVAA